VGQATDHERGELERGESYPVFGAAHDESKQRRNEKVVKASDGHHGGDGRLPESTIYRGQHDENKVQKAAGVEIQTSLKGQPSADGDSGQGKA
jgi:hypothetical protein